MKSKIYGIQNINYENNTCGYCGRTIDDDHPYNESESHEKGCPIFADGIEELADALSQIIGNPETGGEPDKRIPLREGWKDVWDY